MKWKRQVQETIKESLRGISLDTARVLFLMAQDKNPVIGTTDLRNKISLRENELGGTLRAITSIKIDGKYLVERLPFKTDRNNSLYLWNDNVTHKLDVELVLREILKKYDI